MSIALLAKLGTSRARRHAFHRLGRFQCHAGLLIHAGLARMRKISPPYSKMGTEVEEAPHEGKAPHSSPRPACVYHALQ
jgi:hypothetical protein